MKLLGILLLVAVTVVGFGVFKTALAQPAPIVQVAPSPPRVPDADPRIDELEAQIASLTSQLAETQQVQPEPQHVQSETQTQVPPPPPQAPSGGCRVVLDGYLETSQIIGSPDAQFVHAVYWFQGQPEFNVLLDGAQWQRPSGAGGRFWAYGGGGCTAEFVRANIEGYIERTTLAGTNTGGWGEPSLFSRVG